MFFKTHMLFPSLADSNPFDKFLETLIFYPYIDFIHLFTAEDTKEKQRIPFPLLLSFLGPVSSQAQMCFKI